MKFSVLIESDWNLKAACRQSHPWQGRRINRIRLEFKDRHGNAAKGHRQVLIESDWNLKLCTLPVQSDGSCVLIESDWNLKRYYQKPYPCHTGINRIRLEFKVEP